MSNCPHCNDAIPIEIEQYGGECPNCFRFVDVGLSDNDEFDPTGMFTREQLRQIIGDEDTAPKSKVVSQASDTSVSLDELDEDLYTDEVDLDDVLVGDLNFDDEATEILERTEPLQQTVGAVGAVEESNSIDDDFDFDDEPTVALNSPIPEMSAGFEEDTGSKSEHTPFAEVPEISVANVAGKDNGHVLNAKGESPSLTSSSVVEPEEDSFDGNDDDLDGLSNLDNEQGAHNIDNHANPLSISPQAEGRSRKPDPQPLSSKKEKSFDWKPIGFAGIIIVLAAVFILPSDEPVVTENTDANPDRFVPTVDMGTIAQPEPEEAPKTKKVRKSSQKSTTTRKEPVEISGVNTFQTALPPSMSGPSTTRVNSGDKSEALERDVSKLKRSMTYCHTKALKTDPTVSGKWEVSFRVANGSASGIKIKAMRSPNADIESCMKTKIKRFSFTEGLTQNFTFRMLFER